MKYALFIAEYPMCNTDVAMYQARRNWQDFLAHVKELVKREEHVAERLSDGCYQIKLDSGLKTLVDLVSKAHEYTIITRVMFLDQHPVWSITPP